MAVNPVVYDDTTKKHRPLGSGEKMDGLSASSIISSQTGNLITTGSDGLAYATGSGIADPAADNLLEATSAGKLKVDIDRIIEWLDGHPSDAKAVADAINVVSGDSGNIIHEGTDGGAYMSSAQLAAAIAGLTAAQLRTLAALLAPDLADGLTIVLNAAGKLSVGDVSGVAVAASGASAERALGDRFADFVNVKDFGAAGDGSTDDTAAWTAWQTALASGGVGYIPSGAYLVNGAVKRFPSGCIGQFGDGFSAIKPGFTDRFADAIPVGQGHVIDNSRTITVANSAEGTHIYPTISIDAKIDVPSNAGAVDLDGSLIASCHGLYVQHILTGGNADNRLMSTGIVTNAINDAVGDNDCSGVAARATKTGRAGCVGDTAGLGGRVDSYSHEIGGVMGAEIVAYNYVQGVPCPSDFDNVSTRKWVAPLHVTGSAYREVGAAVYKGSPMTAAILMQGGRNAPSFWDGIQFSYTLFPSFDSDPGSFKKNEILDNPDYAAGETQSYESYTFTAPVGGVDTEQTKYRIPDTVAINMGSFSWSGGFPDTCIKMGKAKQHIWTPDQHLTVRALGQKTTAVASVFYYADAQETAGGDHLDTGFACSHDGVTVAELVQSGEGNDATLAFKNDAAGSGVVLTGGAFRRTSASSALSLGVSGYPWSHVYADTGTVETSDERLKANIEAPSDALMRAWGKVGFKVFQMRDAIAEKGEEAARLHAGVIAQDVQRAFAEEGLDAGRYGLFCHDAWEARPAKYVEWDEEIPAECGEDGVELVPARTVHHKDLTAPAVEAGDKYAVRYEEALCMEAAYVRRELARIKAHLGMDE